MVKTKKCKPVVAATGSANGTDTNITIQNSSLNVFQTLRWEYKLDKLYKSIPDPNQVIVLSKDHTNKNKPNNVYKVYSYIPRDRELLKGLIQQNHHLYEVLPANLPRHFYIDCDIKQGNPLFDQYNYKQIISLITTGIFHILSKAFPRYAFTPCSTAFIVNNDTHKQSCHIIFPTINLKNVQDTKHFTLILKYYIEIGHADIGLHPDQQELLLNTMDYKVYSINQNFRLPYQSKLGKDDTYRLMPFTPQSNDQFYVGIYQPNIAIYYLDSKKLQATACDFAIKYHTIKFNITPQPKQSNTQKECANFATHHFDVFCNLVTASNYNLPTPDAAQPDPIKFLISCIPNSNEHPQHYSLWWAIGQALKNISSDKDKTEQHAYLQLWIDWSNQASGQYGNEAEQCKRTWTSMTVREKKRYQTSFLYSVAKFYHPESCFAKYGNKYMFDDFVDLSKFTRNFNEVSKYNTDSNNLDVPSGFCRAIDFTKYDTLVLQGPMGSGKTYITRRAIQQYNFKRILLISPRQTFCQEKVAELQQICPSFKSYLDEEVRCTWDWLLINKLAIQVESLHHLKNIDVENAYDLLILDEIESIMYQFSSETNKEPELCFQVFMDLLATSKRIIMADAFITNRTLSLCSETLIKEYNRKVNLEINMYNPNSQITANIIGVANNSDKVVEIKEAFVDHMIAKLKDNKKLCVVVSSKLYKDQIISRLTQELEYKDNCNIISYDRETSDEDINMLGQVREVWGNPEVHVIIYTTKITVGINFDTMDIFDNIYIYGSVCCPIARDLMQSHFRVRHIKDPNIYVALNCCPVPEALQDRRDCSIAFSSFMVKSVKKRFDFDTYQRSKTYNRLMIDTYTNITEYNYLEESIGYTMFEDVFKYFLEATGYKVAYTTNVKREDDIPKASFDDTYIKQYIAYRSTSDDDIAKIDARQKMHIATSQDKVTLHAYFFYRKYIYKKITTDEEQIKTILQSDNEYYENLQNKAKSLELSEMEQWECDLYNESRVNNNVERILDNLLLETSEVDTKAAGKNKVLKEQNKLIMLEYIKSLYSLLDMTSFVENKEIGNKELEIVKKWFLEVLTEENRTLIIKLFCIRCSAKTNDVRYIKTIINGMIYRWCGKKFEFDNTCIEKKDYDTNVRYRDYTYKGSLISELEGALELFPRLFERQTLVDETL